MVEQAYGTVQYDRLCEQVARQIQDLILGGHLPVDSQLPPERELAEKFGVSRTVIREAIKLLSERGLVEVVPGRGSFVTRLDAEAVSLYMQLLVKARSASLTQFHEIRSALEVATAGFAAARATHRDIVLLRELVERIDDCLDREDKEGFIEADVRFHALLAESTHNPLFQVVLEPIMGTLAESRRVTYHVQDSPKRGQHFHKIILAAIERADVEGAREAMRQHMAHVGDDIRAAEEN